MACYNMRNSNIGYIGVPLILKAIRDRDFEAQVKGKKAMRNADEKTAEALLTPLKIIRLRLKLMSMQCG